MKYVREKEAPLDDYDIPNGGFGGAFVCERERLSSSSCMQRA